MLDSKRLNSEFLLDIYQEGIFPMWDPYYNCLEFYETEIRAIIPLENYKPSKSLRSVLRSNQFEVRFDTCFEKVMRQCKCSRPYAQQWISEEMIAVYTDLYRRGNAHSVEVFQNGELVGGLYGVHIGAVFMGESMFHRVSNASKVAFHYLIEQLKKQDFRLLDSQIINDFTAKLGAVEIPQNEFISKLKSAVRLERKFMDFENNNEHLLV